MLGREARLAAVVDGAEGDAVVVDARDRVAQREDLEAARVGEDRPVPGHEAVQPAELGDQLVAGPEVQVVRVAEHDLRARARELARVEPLTVAFVPTGMKAGVWTRPCAVCSTPAPRGAVGATRP